MEQKVDLSEQGILAIPKSDQYIVKDTLFFQFKHDNIIERDVCARLEKNSVHVLRSLCLVLDPKINIQLRKKDLINIIKTRIKFE